MKQGITCPGCGSTSSATVDSRHVLHGKTRRRRQCNDCSARFTTYESMFSGNITPAPAFARREKFLVLCLEAGATPDEALAAARDMETFVGGTGLPPAAEPPAEPAKPFPQERGERRTPPSDESSPDSRKRVVVRRPTPKPAAAPPAATRSRGGDGQPVLSPERRAEFKEAWTSMMRPGEIAERFGMEKSTVYLWAKRLGLHRRVGRVDKFPPLAAPAAEAPPAAAAAKKMGRKKTWTPDKIDAFTQMWIAGAPIKEIAMRFDLTRGSAYARAHALKLGRRPGARGLRPAVSPSPQDAPLPDTSGLPAAPTDWLNEIDVTGVIRYLQSRDVILAKDPNSHKTPRWLIEGRRDRALTADELLVYANTERRLSGQPELHYAV